LSAVLRQLPERLPPKFIEEAKKLFSLTSETKLEAGAAICYNPETGDLFLHDTCLGTECSVASGKLSCPAGTIRVGTMHSHPKGPPLWSWGDVHYMIGRGEEFSCIISRDAPYILCSLRKKSLTRRDKLALRVASMLFGIPPDFHEHYESALYDLADGEKLEDDALRAAVRAISRACEWHLARKIDEVYDEARSQGLSPCDAAERAISRVIGDVKDDAAIYCRSWEDTIPNHGLVRECITGYFNAVKDVVSTFAKLACRRALEHAQ